MNKKLSCLLCWLPFILFFGTCIPLLVLTFQLELGTVDDSAIMVTAILLALGAFLAVVAVYGVMIWLIVKVCKNHNITGGMKAVWIVCLYFFNVFTYPVYWFIHIRHE